MVTKLIIAIGITATIIVLAIVLERANTNVELHQLDVKTKQSEIDSLETRLNTYRQKIEQAEGNEDKLKQLEAEYRAIDEENKRLQAELQAKLEKRAEEARNAAIAQSVPQPTAPSGDWVANCHAWAAEAGVVLDDSAIKLIERESKCDPIICNPNGIACGIPQALPWTKMGCDLSHEDAPCQIKWFEQYVIQRYGSYANALAHSYAHNWY